MEKVTVKIHYSFAHHPFFDTHINDEERKKLNERFRKDTSFSAMFYQNGKELFAAIFDIDRSAINIRQVAGNMGQYGEYFKSLETFAHGFAIYKEKFYITVETIQPRISKWFIKQGFKTKDGKHFFKRVT